MTRKQTAVLAVVTAVLATMGWVGVYMVAFGAGDASAAGKSAVPVGLTPGASVERVTGKPVAPASVAARARAEVKKLPQGKLSNNQKRLALQAYTEAIGLDLSGSASPASAARSACRLLGTGTEPQDLVDGVAQGGQLTKAQSRAFLLGATTLYCPKEAKPFRR
ncbi:MAG: DUF732 domain-containing protein [Sporichthyaceae bacterium]